MKEGSPRALEVKLMDLSTILILLALLTLIIALLTARRANKAYTLAECARASFHFATQLAAVRDVAILSADETERDGARERVKRLGIYIERSTNPLICSIDMARLFDATIMAVVASMRSVEGDDEADKFEKELRQYVKMVWERVHRYRALRASRI